jgi:HK97 family phage prohead protease
MKKPPLFMGVQEFCNRAKDNPDDIKDAAVRASEMDTEIKAGAEGDRTVQFTISTPSVDRMNDTIAVDGWKLDNYRKNPQVLFNHQADTTIGIAEKVWIEDNKLKAIAEFQPPEISRFADAIYRMLTHPKKFIRAVSVGFRPLTYSFTEDPKRAYGINFLTQELLEFSVCSIPANQDCLMDAKSVGIDIAPMLDWCEDQMKRAGDNARIINLAEGVLGGKGDDPASLAWAERIVGAAGQAIIHADRLAAMKALAEEFRADAKKSAGSKGASGIYRRCANRVEKAVMGEGQESPPEITDNQESVAVNIAPGFAEIAARRLKTVRHKAI